MFSIYQITNSVNGKRYVGFTTNNDVKRRFEQHCRTSKGRSRSTLHSAIVKYGKDKFHLKVLEVGENEVYGLKIAESMYINWLKPEYNMTQGGDGCLGYKHTAESLSKISKASKEKWNDPTKRSLLVSKAKERCKSVTERTKLRNKVERFWYDPQYHDVRVDRNIRAGLAISKAKRGIPLSEEHKKALQIPKNTPPWNKGKKLNSLSEEHKEKQRVAMTGYRYSIVECTHCKKRGGESSMRRWHFDNCKKRNDIK